MQDWLLLLLLLMVSVLWQALPKVLVGA